MRRSTFHSAAYLPGLLIAVLLAFWAPRAPAAELVMFYEKWCPWCELWDRQVGVVYPRTSEGRRAPLRRVDIHGKFPQDMKLSSRPRFTPTFVLVENGREVGRIEGYPGEDFFWAMLARLLTKLPATAPD